LLLSAFDKFCILFLYNKKGQNKNSYITILTLYFYLKDSS